MCFAVTGGETEEVGAWRLGPRGGHGVSARGKILPSASWDSNSNTRDRLQSLSVAELVFSGTGGGGGVFTDRGL